MNSLINATTPELLVFALKTIAVGMIIVFAVMLAIVVAIVVKELRNQWRNKHG